MNIHTIFLPCINFNSKPLFVCQKIKGFHFHLIKNKCFMPSFDYQKKNIWKKKNCRALLFKMLKLRVLDIFSLKCFCYYTESKVPKKGTVGYRYRISGIDTGIVLVQMWTVPNYCIKMLDESIKMWTTFLKCALKKLAWGFYFVVAECFMIYLQNKFLDELTVV